MPLATESETLNTNRIDKPERKSAWETVIQGWTTSIGQATGHPAAFAVVIAYAALWLLFSRQSFDWNAVATLAVWTMTLFIQRSTRRDTLALHAKIDELIRVDKGARSELARLDEREPEDIQKHRDLEKLATKSDGSESLR